MFEGCLLFVNNWFLNVIFFILPYLLNFNNICTSEIKKFHINSGCNILSFDASTHSLPVCVPLLKTNLREKQERCWQGIQSSNMSQHE